MSKLTKEQKELVKELVTQTLIGLHRSSFLSSKFSYPENKELREIKEKLGLDETGKEMVDG